MVTSMISGALRPFWIPTRAIPGSVLRRSNCGAVWIDEQYLALQFACNTCLAKDGQAPAPLPEPARRSGARRRYRRRE